MKSIAQILRSPRCAALPLAAAALFVGASLASAQSAPPLGVIQQFSVLGGSAATGSTGTGTTVNGDVGSCPTSTVTNFPPSTVVSPFILHNAAACDGTVTTARADATTAFNFLGVPQGAGTTIADNLTGQVLGSGVYNLGAALLPNGGTLTLNGPGIFVFRTGSTLTTVGSSAVVLNNVNPCNIYWQVGSSATLDSLSGFPGNIFAQASITISAATSLTGRAIAGTAGFVTMSGSGGNTIGGCATPALAPCPAITLAPTTLPNGGIAIAYNQTITASGGLAPYTFSLTSGALPGGLSLSTGGAITGTPTAAGTFTFTVQANDNNGCPGTRIYTIVVPPAGCPAILLAPATVPGGVVATAYNQTITASGGLAPYAFTVTAGSLPPGLTLTAAGVLSGTPTTVGSSTFTVRGTDANGCFGAINYTMAVTAVPVPTLSEWAMIGLALLLGFAGWAGLRGKNPSTAS